MTMAEAAADRQSPGTTVLDAYAACGWSRRPASHAQQQLKGAAPMSGDLTLDVYVSDYKPIPGDPAVMSEGRATWPASSVSLLSGKRDAVLIDALITFDEARQAAEWIRGKGKRLTTIYITHGHGDHMFGLNTLLAAFPGARAVALSEVMPAIQSQVTPSYLEFWGTLFPGQIPERPVLPEALGGNVIDLEGHELRLINVGQSDTDPSTVVHVPDLDAVVGGDVCYNRIHVWLALTNHNAGLAWIDTIGKIEALAPRIVVAGHKAPGAPDDDLAELIAGTRQYIIDFDEAERASGTREELVEKMLAAHGDRGNVYSLWAAATAVFGARDEENST
jgi:glyoxylase-like metal-dependent hydrolase (beta-lactamase superfamily II)